MPDSTQKFRDNRIAVLLFAPYNDNYSYNNAYHFGFVFSNFVLLDLVFSVSSQEIGWKERLRNDLR